VLKHTVIGCKSKTVYELESVQQLNAACENKLHFFRIAGAVNVNGASSQV
jgi:hypothetical protein